MPKIAEAERHVEDQGRDRQQVRNEAEEAQVIDREAIRGDQVFEQIECGAGAETARRDGSRQPGLELRGFRRRTERLEVVGNPGPGVLDRSPINSRI